MLFVFVSTPNSFLISLNAICLADSVFETISGLGSSVVTSELCIVRFRSLINALFGCSTNSFGCSILLYL